MQENMQWQEVVENQREILRLLRALTSNSVGGVPVDIGDLITQPAELEELCEKLEEDVEFKLKMVRTEFIQSS